MPVPIPTGALLRLKWETLFVNYARLATVLLNLKRKAGIF
jgi:hypothetical protein